MENVTKALLIAAATLLAILLISLGIFVYNKAANQTNQVNLNGLQIQQFNEQFLRYAGENVSGADVNIMLKSVLNHNITQEDDSTTVEVYHLGQDIGPNDTVIPASKQQLQSAPEVPRHRRYEVRVIINEQTQLVNLIQYYAYGETTEPE